VVGVGTIPPSPTSTNTRANKRTGIVSNTQRRRRERFEGC
jgi:hypothetical protein